MAPGCCASGSLGSLVGSGSPSAVDGPSEGLFNSEKLAVIATWQARIGWYLDGIVYGGMFDGTVSTAAKGEATGRSSTSLRRPDDGAV